MHWPEFVFGNVARKILWAFEIQTNHIIPVRKPDIVLTNQKKIIWSLVDFADHRMKIKEIKKTDKYLDLARELKKKTLMNESQGNRNCI